VHNLSYEIEFYLHVNETHFYLKGFTLRLALEKRYKATRKWHITVTLLCKVQSKVYEVISLQRFSIEPNQ